MCRSAMPRGATVRTSILLRVSDITRLETLTKDSFLPARGERFRVSLPPEGGSHTGGSDTSGSGSLDVTLTDVASNGLRGHGREQFSVHFLGPRDPVLPQMIYRLENPHLGVLEIFLVPISRDASGVTYEAVFA
jgi:hypothetical protein